MSIRCAELWITVAVYLCDPVRMTNITVSVPDDVYRRARVHAAEQGRSVSALVAEFLEAFANEDEEFSHVEALQHRVEREIARFRAGDRLPRDEVHDRALR